jgi:hypothetical protein
VPVTAPDQCCPSQCSPCPPCPFLQCPAGYHAETAPGSCCPHCAADVNAAACVKGRVQYAMQRQAMLDKYSYGCASNSECVAVIPRNACEQGCSNAALWYGLADSFEANLSALASMTCSSCMQAQVPFCEPSPKPSCFDGRCAF